MTCEAEEGPIRLFMESELNEWHDTFSTHNEEAIKKSALVGCYYCGEFSGSVNVVDWVKDKHGRTGICPHCGIDSLLPDSCIKPLTIWHLRAMYDHWFGRTYGVHRVDHKTKIDKHGIMYLPRAW